MRFVIVPLLLFTIGGNTGGRGGGELGSGLRIIGGGGEGGRGADRPGSAGGGGGGGGGDEGFNSSPFILAHVQDYLKY